MTDPIRLTILILSLVIIGGAILALLLFMLVFPLVNAMFGLDLPAFRYGEPSEPPPATMSRPGRRKPKTAKVQKQKRPKRQGAEGASKEQEVPTQAIESKETDTTPRPTTRSGARAKKREALKIRSEMIRNHKTPTKKKPQTQAKKTSQTQEDVKKTSQTQSGGTDKAGVRAPLRSVVRKKEDTPATASSVATKKGGQRTDAVSGRTPRAPDLHKDIPTVRIDTLFAPEQSNKPLTAAKIDAEGRRATKLETAAQKPAIPPVLPKKPTKKQRKDSGEPDTVEIQ